MPEKEIQSTGDPKVDAALARIRGKFQDLEDAMLVQGLLEKRTTDQMKQHAQLLADHGQMLAEHDAWSKAHRRGMRRIRVKLEEATEKINFLVIREMHREGGPETKGDAR